MKKKKSLTIKFLKEGGAPNDRRPFRKRKKMVGGGRKEAVAGNGGRNSGTDSKVACKLIYESPPPSPTLITSQREN